MAPIEEGHYVRNARKQQLAVEILDYQDVILEEISKRTKHNKRNVLIAILDLFFTTQKEWLEGTLKIEYPEDLKKQTPQKLSKLYGYPLKNR